MSTFKWSIERRNMLVEVEIEYECTRGYWDNTYGTHHEYWYPGDLDLLDVRVIDVTGYEDAAGEVVYFLKRDEVSPTWLATLEAICKETILHETQDSNSLLADYMSEAAL